jgi:esterase/lipase superfamily enzyme
MARPPSASAAPAAAHAAGPTARRTDIAGQEATVVVSFATDRNLMGQQGGRVRFGGLRSALVYGRAEVTFPANHTIGEVERPEIWEVRENPTRHVVIRRSGLLDSTAWMDGIRRRTERSPKRRLFLFVHGYNVPFDDAVRRTAQITYDVQFDGPALLFSWPSAGRTLGYWEDETSVRYAEPHLEAVLRDVLAKSGAQEVYIVAHSMGNRLVTAVVPTIGRSDPAARRRIKDIILAAPDVDADVFRREIAPALPQAGSHITLYASSKDWALTLSKTVHAGQARAGDTSGRITIVPSIDTIDASSLSADFLGHSYVGSSGSVLADLRRLMDADETPFQRGMTEKRQGAQIYWSFP